MHIEEIASIISSAIECAATARRGSRAYRAPLCYHGGLGYEAKMVTQLTCTVAWRQSGGSDACAASASARGTSPLSPSWLARMHIIMHLLTRRRLHSRLLFRK